MKKWVNIWESTNEDRRSPLSRKCLDDIHDYLVEIADEGASTKVLTKIYFRAESLSKFPKRGRILPEISDPRVREVLEGAYRIIYELDSTDSPSTVSILVVVHSAQMLRNTPLSEYFEE